MLDKVGMMQWLSAAHAMQEAAGLPHMIGLDLDPSSMDNLQLQPALAVAQVDGLDHREVDKLLDDKPRYLCLTSNNRSA